jgi:hypothetical protein
LNRTFEKNKFWLKFSLIKFSGFSTESAELGHSESVSWGTHPSVVGLVGFCPEHGQLIMADY